MNEFLSDKIFLETPSWKYIAFLLAPFESQLVKYSSHSYLKIPEKSDCPIFEGNVAE